MVRFLSWLESFLIFCLCDAMKYFKEKATNSNQINWINQLWKIKHRIIGSHHIQIQNVKKGCCCGSHSGIRKCYGQLARNLKHILEKGRKQLQLWPTPSSSVERLLVGQFHLLNPFLSFFSSSIRKNHTGCNKQKNHKKAASICRLQLNDFPYIVVLNLIFFLKTFYAYAKKVEH